MTSLKEEGQTSQELHLRRNLAKISKTFIRKIPKTFIQIKMEFLFFQIAIFSTMQVDFYMGSVKQKTCKTLKKLETLVLILTKENFIFIKDYFLLFLDDYLLNAIFRRTINHQCDPLLRILLYICSKTCDYQDILKIFVL